MPDGGRIESSLLHWSDAPRDVEALIEGSHAYDYPALIGAALRFAADLARNGVEPGDRVAIYFGQTSDAVVALYAAWIAGAIAVPANGSLKSAQVAHILRHSESRVLVSGRRKLAQLDPDVYSGVHVIEAPALAARDDESQHAERPRDLPGGDAPAAILYTSGSTGRPKGILISHANLLAGARIVSDYLHIRPDERILSVLPFSFDYGLNQLLTAVHRGATLILQRSHLAADVCRSLAIQRITALAGVPPLWMQLMDKRSPIHRMKFPHLRYITNSGGTFPRPLVQRYRELLPHVSIYLMYGLSEAFRSSYLPPEELDGRPDSMGKPIPETELMVLDPEDRPCAPGEPGELVHRGPTVALGYWRDPEATERVFRADPEGPEGPERPQSPRRVVYSGDVVKRDAEGFLYFVGRRDQLIKSYGYRVSPDEVEEMIQRSKLVAEVVVHGRADELAGTAIIAHVVPIDALTFDAQALLDYCRREMPAYMVPKAIEVHERLPRTASGKMDRKALSG